MWWTPNLSDVGRSSLQAWDAQCNGVGRPIDWGVGLPAVYLFSAPFELEHLNNFCGRRTKSHGRLAMTLGVNQTLSYWRPNGIGRAPKCCSGHPEPSPIPTAAAEAMALASWFLSRFRRFTGT